MKRRSFISAIMGGLAVLPFIGKDGIGKSLNRERVALTHRESRSGIRCTDVRVVVSDIRDFQGSANEEAILRIVQKNRSAFRAL